MKNKQHKYHGQCLRSAIQYPLVDLSSRVGHCHCTMCRKSHVAKFATFGEVKCRDFRWIKGKTDLSPYTASYGTTRKFCRHCGSSLLSEASDANGSCIEITLGTPDTPIPQMPDAHIFVANKANWHTISDDLLQFEVGRNGHATK